MNELLRLIVYVMLLSPFIGATVIAAMSRRIGAMGAEAVGIVMGGMSVFMAFLLGYHLVDLRVSTQYIPIYRWLDFEPTRIIMGLWVDHISVSMASMVAFIGCLVQIYSTTSMQKDPGYTRYCALMNLFVGTMLLLVMSSHMVMMFFAWEGLSVVSYGLISFWFEKKSAASSAFKALFMNRIGDFFLLTGIILWHVFGGSWELADILAMTTTGSPLPLGWKTDVVVLCLMLGIMTKSAQIPFHVWLPDAMEGPMPVSVLLHSATMVTAGIFWAVRYSAIFALSPLCNDTLMVVAATGACIMAVIACFEDNVKRVMAYSTLSQLAIMACAVGAGAYSLALFHLFTHAFSKAVLFLAVGKVVWMVDHQLSLQAMGGLWRRTPLMALVVLLSGLALVGIPPFSGYWSKEALLTVLFAQPRFIAQYAAWMLVLSTAATAAYLIIMWKKMFWGTQTSPIHSSSSAAMTLPIMLLLLPSLYSGAYLFPKMLYPLYWHMAASPSIQQQMQRLQHQAMTGGRLLVTVATLAGIVAWYGEGGWRLPRFLNRFYLQIERDVPSLDAVYIRCGQGFYKISLLWHKVDNKMFYETWLYAAARLLHASVFVVQSLSGQSIARYMYSTLVSALLFLLLAAVMMLV